MASVASVDGAQPPPGCSRERAPIARLTFATPEHRGQERRRRRRRSTAFYGGPGGRHPRPLRYRAQATGLRGLSVALAAARHTRMVRSPKLQCQSGRPALGSSRARLRAPASAGYPSQSSTGRDRCGGGRRCCSSDGAVTGGVWARCGGNGWGECGEAIGIFGWERNLGVENRRRLEDLRTVANARFASRGRCGPATGDVGAGAPATAHRLRLRSALCPRGT